MEAYQQLFQYTKQFADLSLEEFDILKNFTCIRKFKKKEFLITGGEIEGSVYFISEGLIREFIIKNKRQVTTDIIRAGTIVSSISSFFTGLSSKYYIQAIEPVTAVVISKAALEQLYSRGVKWERFGRMITGHFLLQQEIRILDTIRYSVRERFVNFIKSNPDLLERVQHKQLASYLEIEPETFSRLKRFLEKNNGA